MRTFILTEDKVNKLKREMIRESFGDKVVLVKNFLDSNFMRATLTQNDDNGLKKNVGVFIQLGPNRLPTDTRLDRESVLDIVQNKFNKILTDKKERDRFLLQVIDDWYYNKKNLKNGVLSRYDF